jgi:hypothetical protein
MLATYDEDRITLSNGGADAIGSDLLFGVVEALSCVRPIKALEYTGVCGPSHNDTAATVAQQKSGARIS